MPSTVLIRCFLFLLIAFPVVGQTVATAPTNNITPTVTIAMGDLGGKFFGKIPDPAKTRHYYIAADPEIWDYAPEGRDVVCGKPIPPPILAKRRGGKIRYVQYTDDTFQAKVIQTPRLGIMGPVLRGVVGEFLAITFVNRGGVPLSMHPHGVKYDKDSEGSYYLPKPGLGAAVGAGAKFTYVWHLDEESGPMPNEPSSKAWLYHSHVESDEEVDRGLMGFIVVTDPKRARPDGTPNDIDRELSALFMIHDESGVGAAAKEAAEYGTAGINMPSFTWTQIQEQMEQGARHGINGYIFGNAPGLEMNEGERVRWYLFALGSENDFHTAHWHGMRVTEEGRRKTDVIELLPASMKVGDMVADNPGTWLFHCHVSDHMMEGMFARVVIHPKGSTRLDKPADSPFFGLPKSLESLRLTRAELTPTELRLEGSITVFQAFSVFTQPVDIKIGDKTVTFQPDRLGKASNPSGTFTIKNASKYGVIYGGLMEFETTITSKDLIAAVKNLKSPTSDGTPITIQVGTARHTTTLTLTPKPR